MTQQIKAIFVTGANKGIGKAICEEILLQHTDTIVFLGSRDLERGQSAIDDIVNRNGDSFKDRLYFVQSNVGDEKSVLKAAETVSDKLAELNEKSKDKSFYLYGLVNNAGVIDGIKYIATYTYM